MDRICVAAPRRRGSVVKSQEIGTGREIGAVAWQWRAAADHGRGRQASCAWTRSCAEMACNNKLACWVVIISSSSAPAGLSKKNKIVLMLRDLGRGNYDIWVQTERLEGEMPLQDARACWSLFIADRKGTETGQTFRSFPHRQCHSNWLWQS